MNSNDIACKNAITSLCKERFQTRVWVITKQNDSMGTFPNIYKCRVYLQLKYELIHEKFNFKKVVVHKLFKDL